MKTLWNITETFRYYFRENETKVKAKKKHSK